MFFGLFQPPLQQETGDAPGHLRDFLMMESQRSTVSTGP
jgi:hypothetical protein